MGVTDPFDIFSQSFKEGQEKDGTPFGIGQAGMDAEGMLLRSLDAGSLALYSRLAC